MSILHLSRPISLALLVAGSSLLGALETGYLRREPGSSAPAPVVYQCGPGDAEHGRKLFVQSCAHCHGDDAHGSGEDSDGPDLYELSIGNARIATVIRQGIAGEMPSFAKKHGPQDLADLTAYLRTLR